MIIIGKPYLTHTSDKVRLNADITIGITQHVMYYEVEKRYEESLVIERSDSFFVGLLPYALSKGDSIQSEAPISEKLMYQVQNHLLPGLHKYGEMSLIDVTAETTSKKLNTQEAVGTGFSGGVDSFYTLASHLDSQIKGFKVTHLTFLNVGSHGDFGGEEARKLFNERSQLAKDYSKEMDMELILIDSNISEIVNMTYIKSHTFRSLAAILALQKLFHVYYYSSGYDLNHFEITKEDTAAYDLLNMHVLSTEDISFYSTGSTTTRLEKVQYIADYKPSYEFLNVCQVSEHNCGTCEKCRRTMLELYATSNLDKYENVFDVQKFHKNRSNRLGYLLFQKGKKDYQEVLEKIKEENIVISPVVYLHFLLFRFKNLFREQEQIKRVYFRLKGKYHFE